MCQNIFYKYACLHVECVTYRCDKCAYPSSGTCLHRQKALHTSLADQLCHDCVELSSKIRQEHQRWKSYLQGQQQEPQSQSQSQPQSHPQPQQHMYRQQQQQEQSTQDPQSSSPDGKAIRPLESNKLANMDCHLEASFGLAPSDVYHYYVAGNMQ